MFFCCCSPLGEAMAYITRINLNKIARYVGVQAPQQMPSGAIVVDNILRVIQDPHLLFDHL